MSERPIALVGFADALAAIESAWSLLDDGFDVVAFARAGRPPPLARVAGVRVVPVTPPEQDVKATLADLRRLVAGTGPAVVLPLDDHAVWLVDHVAADDVTLIVAGPTGDRAAVALDKRQQLAAAAAAGLAVPPTTDGSVPPAGDGPWVVKSALAVVERDGRLARPPGARAATPAAVTAAVEALPGPALVQPVVEGVGEGVFGLATDRGVEAWSAHRRIRMMNPKGSGSSACRSLPVDGDLRAGVERFLAATRWRGVFMVELLRDAAGTAWTMELNGRLWGSLALARHRGFAYPAWAARLALDPTYSPAAAGTVPADPPEVTARHLGRELVHVAAVARGAARRSGDGPPLGRTLVDVVRVRRGDRWYNWRPGAARVLAADTVGTVRSQLGRRS